MGAVGGFRSVHINRLRHSSSPARRGRGTAQRAGEGAIARSASPPLHNCPFILPMSGRNWKFITTGIPVLAARSVSDRCRSGLTVGMSGCKFQLVRSC